MDVITYNNKVSAQASLNTVVLNIAFFILSLFCSLNLTAQCAATIDNIADLCLTAGAAKTFSNATASGGIIDWISSGDGKFNNNSLVKPTYTPGPADLANGYVFIYLDVYKDDSVSPCSVLPFVTIHFNPAKAVTTPAAQTVCSGSTINPIILSGGSTGSAYTWTRNNTASVTGIGASGTGNIVGSVTNLTSASVKVTFTVTPQADGCTGAPVAATVQVKPTPVATATPISQTIRSKSNIKPIVLTGTVTRTTFSWTRNETASVKGIAASGSGKITGRLTNSTKTAIKVTFTITPTAKDCPGTPITATVLVNPANTASLAGIAPNEAGNISGALRDTTASPVMASNRVGKMDKAGREMSPPIQYSLSNYPNPFVGTSTIKYKLPLNSKVSIKVYDVAGRVVATLVDEYKKAGTYTVNFNAGHFSSGSLFYKIVAKSKEGQYEQTNQMIKIK